MTAFEIVNQEMFIAEQKALNALDHRKYMMYGYYKAIGVYLRRIARRIKHEVG